MTLIYYQPKSIKMKSPKEKAIGWLLVSFWFLVVTYLSLSPSLTLEIPKGLEVDKLAHFAMYAILVVLFTIPMVPFSKAFNFFLIIAFLMAGATELTQHYFVKNRVGDWYDFFANLLGLFTTTFVLTRRIKT